MAKKKPKRKKKVFVPNIMPKFKADPESDILLKQLRSEDTNPEVINMIGIQLMKHIIRYGIRIKKVWDSPDIFDYTYDLYEVMKVFNDHKISNLARRIIIMKCIREFSDEKILSIFPKRDDFNLEIISHLYRNTMYKLFHSTQIRPIRGTRQFVDELDSAGWGI